MDTFSGEASPPFSFHLYVQQIIHSLGLDQHVHKRIVNKIFPVPDQQ